MKKLTLILICTVIVCSCSVTHKFARDSEIYQFVSFDQKTQKVRYRFSGCYLIFQNDGLFFYLNEDRVFRGHWTFTGPKQILLKCVPEPPKTDLATIVTMGYIAPPHNWKIEFLNKNRIRVNGSNALIYERVK